jgi:dihydrofolate reductase
MVNIAAFYEGEADRAVRSTGSNRSSGDPRRATTAVYVNFLVDEGEDAIRALPGATWDRLAAIKRATTRTTSSTATRTFRRLRLMGTVVYSMMVSLDGFVETPDHSLDWVIIDDEIHRFANEQTRRAALDVYGRGMWETMSYWSTARPEPGRAGGPGRVREDLAGHAEGRRLAQHRNPWTARTSVSSAEDGVEDVRRLAAETDGEVAVSGATLAGSLIRRASSTSSGCHESRCDRAGTPFLPPGRRSDRWSLSTPATFASGVTFRAYRRRDS